MKKTDMTNKYYTPECISISLEALNLLCVSGDDETQGQISPWHEDNWDNPITF